MSGVFDHLTALASPWAYVVVGLLAALEASAFVGLFIPGELAVLTGGYIAFQGRAGLALMMAAAGCGAIAGDSVGYEIGRHFGDRLRNSRLGRRVGSERWGRAEAYLADHGGRAVFLGRFIGVLRALVPALAGASRMPYRKFVAWNALGGVLWAPGLVLVGYAAGSSYRRVDRYAGRAGLMLAVVVLVTGAIVVVARAIARHPTEVRAMLEDWLDRPLVRRLRARYRRQIDFTLRRFRPGQALGLSLTIQLAVLSLFGWLFGSVVQDVVARDELVHIDGPVTRYVVGHRTEWLTTVMRAVSLLGSTVVLVPVVFIVGVWARRTGRGWRPLALLAGAQLGSIALYDLIKPLVGRPRPAVGHLVATATGFSFPSGHATQATAVLGALAYLASATAPWRTRVAAWAAATIVVLLVGFSRVYLGVHWASDVIGGWTLGALWLAALLATARALPQRRGEKLPAVTRAATGSAPR
jgi:undecaprenyl-diphosphatase